MAADDGASSISVTVRVRPFTIREAAQLTKTDDGPLFLGDGSLAGAPTPKLNQKGIRQIIKVVDDRCLVFDPPEENPVQKFSRSVVPQGKRTKDQTFAFDKIFDENTTQGDVYESTTKPLLDSVLDGYNATVFAYGATGCGKTHTITGTVQQPGIIFLTMQELFEKIGELQSEKVTEISLSYLEIYNETIRDLLVPGGSKQPLMLREDANQAVSVSGLSSHHPQNVQEVMDMIVCGNEYRTMSPTEANATSSRSHAVLQINVSSKDRNADINEPHTMATLSIIDLAGSERASATKNRGERLIEGANINKSLLALGSCINALCDPRKKNHVPYRNSKLTRLLKFSLGGNCKTVMIVCVSPSSAHFDETQNTLRYANRAKNIQTKVTRNVFNVNRHVKDFLKKIDEQMTLINELKAQQKEYELVAFGKFKKTMEKREAICREGIQRLRAAYEHCLPERQERIVQMKKLRQIEHRIALINAWQTAFDEVCEIRDEEEPPQHLIAMRKTGHGILMELESSRHHYHQRQTKNNWQRAIDTALQTGIKQLQELEGGADGSDLANLDREAELLKSNAEREFHIAVLEHEKEGDTGLIQVLLHAHFETIAIVNQLQMMTEEDAVQAAKGILVQMMNACCDASSQVIRSDGTLPVIEAAPPSKAGTPKRRKTTSLIGPSPVKSMLAVPAIEAVRLSSSPMKVSSPRRHLLGGPKRGVAFTPRKKSPVKRAVRWRDDTEDGKLAEYDKTPQAYDSTPTNSSIEMPPPPLPSFLPAEEPAGSDASSSPLPPVPQTSLDSKPKSDRFQTGFLSRRPGGSPQAPALTAMSSSPEPSPLHEVSGNRKPPRTSLEKKSIFSENTQMTDSSGHASSGSDSEGSWKAEPDEARSINKAIKRASLGGRQSSIRDSNRIHRRRSPPTAAAATASSPAGDNPLFTASHARRMVKGERPSDVRSSFMSPHATPVMKHTPSSARRTTFDDGKLQRSNSRGSHVRMSSISNTAPVRNSLVTAPKGAWR